MAKIYVKTVLKWLMYLGTCCKTWRNSQNYDFCHTSIREKAIPASKCTYPIELFRKIFKRRNFSYFITKPLPSKTFLYLVYVINLILEEIWKI